MWEYRIGAYQVLEKYLKDRKKEKRKLFIAGGDGALYESGESNKKDD